MKRSLLWIPPVLALVFLGVIWVFVMAGEPQVAPAPEYPVEAAVNEPPPVAELPQEGELPQRALPTGSAQLAQPGVPPVPPPAANGALPHVYSPGPYQEEPELDVEEPPDPQSGEKPRRRLRHRVTAMPAQER